ncbi:MAG: hypothetical protein A2381_17425 [Bdellovibrionales bacterium RIFOXYB1_FULL_37_110]|nr:MAG: hypothetical protein A2181_00945 [Bdellovibrionales bacterium RIFOXYA1_FULL_38_20]OFZ48059.1 MAG: hypothetical protein A2417_15415 [Bdellovibrionales bacterium RIFOXYC1_FULL_37_79]OFZ58067.1 MAG: hypothetical protein A2381_17425 [Bdellovibrionales bacterium RIFOXYB1_FULL_37_110]OFZ63352.1 MAG: hypothetical protein A2577_17545 [Bdellovibrionales bacterium RIFOXYD1_FULL_36_51]
MNKIFIAIIIGVGAIGLEASELDLSKCEFIKHKDKISKDYKLCKWGGWSVFYKKGNIRLAEYVGSGKTHVTPNAKGYQVKIFDIKNVADYVVSIIDKETLIKCFKCKIPPVVDIQNKTQTMSCSCKDEK